MPRAPDRQGLRELQSRRRANTILVAHFEDSRGDLQFAEWRSTLDPELLQARGVAAEVRASMHGLLARLGARLLSLQLLSGDEPEAD